MAIIKPFSCLRPAPETADRVAALPYDVYNRREAKEETEREPLSFLKIDRAETQMDASVDTYDQRVYEKAKELMEQAEAEGIFRMDGQKAYYIYELIMDGRSQTGIVACASIDDYENNVIKKHELTREEKERDRIRHVDVLDAQTGPIFLAYRASEVISGVTKRVMEEEEKLYGFTSPDGVTHNVWKIGDQEEIRRICHAFEEIGQIYIADGHHRAASAVKVGLKRRQEHPDYDGTEEFNFFLSVLFPDDQLMILPYNRVVKDLNGLTPEQFLQKISSRFRVEEVGLPAVSPKKKGVFGMYLEGSWYRLTYLGETEDKDPVEQLDVSVLQRELLEPVLGIGDPRIDSRIDFVGGIRGTKELERRVRTDMKVAFSMYPTSIRELFAVADADRLMPPKSTWFEPKLRSGLFIHKLS